MSHFDNSGSEDGQLRSPTDEVLFSGNDNDVEIEEGDTDSLDIKPPQAAQRELTNKRITKSSKEKKHSKDHKHSKERDRNRDRTNVVETANPHYRQQKFEKDNRRIDEQRHRHIDTRDQRNDNRNDRRHGNYRNRGDFHQQKQHHQQYQDRVTSGGGGGGDYDFHNQNQGRKQHRIGPGGDQRLDKHRRSDFPLPSQSSVINRNENRDRRKYIDEQSPTDAAERALEDLRSRLLSKRHKYESAKENAQTRYDGNSSEENQQHSQQHSSRGSSKTSNEHQHRHKRRRDNRKDDTIIEVIDSPEQVIDLRKPRILPEDPDLAARRAKLLEADREMSRRKEVAREELEARRELKRCKESDSSPAAQSSTGGTHSKKKKRHRANNDNDESGEEEKHRHRHHKKKMKKNKDRVEAETEKSPVEEGEYNDQQNSDQEQHSEYSTGEEDVNAGETDDDEDDSELSSEMEDEQEEEDEAESQISSNDSRHSHSKNVKKKKKKHRRKSTDHEDELPVSPISLGELSKSPRRKEHSSRSRSLSHSEHSKSSRSRSKSRSRYGSRSRSGSEYSDRSRLSASRSRSRSDSMSATSDEEHTRKKKRKRNKRNRGSDTDDELNIKDDGSKRGEIDEPIKVDSPCDEKGEKLPNYFPGIQGCRSVEEFQCLNRIEEGTYGVVYRAKDKRTNEIVALKRLKMEKEKEGFPITSLREINTLLKGQHPNIVTVREIVVGSNMDKIFIVMDYVEHDLKSLMETMKHKEQSFFPAEVKCLVQQLLRAVGHLHDNWILHRDLKTSNLLLSHKGILKVGDFGLAREYGSPLKAYTSLVVTLWYRAPELLLCSKEYSTPIDMWSVGCIFAEFMQMGAMFPGKSEIDQLNRIFKELGTPNEKIWPGYKALPAVQNLLSQNSSFSEYPVSNLRRKFFSKTTEVGISLLEGLLTYDPKQRLTAENALKHSYFKELPLPIDPSMFPTWPAKSELGARKALASSPKPPSGGSQFKQLGRDDIMLPPREGKIVKSSSNSKATGFVLNTGIEQRQVAMGPGFNLKF